MSLSGIDLGEFTIGTLLAGLIFSTFGVYFFRRGKKQSNFLRMGVGAVLFVYPYFVTHPVFVWVIGAALMTFGFMIRDY